jgi:hypothetical protein
MSAQHTPGPSPEHFEMMRGALDHIARTARRSRTSTRRLRWIEHRAEMAIKGERYDDEAFDLPKSAGPNTVANLERKIGLLLGQRMELLEALVARQQVDKAYANLALMEVDEDEHERLLSDIEDAEEAAKQASRAAIAQANGSAP